MSTRLLPLAVTACLALGACAEGPPTIAIDCYTRKDPMNCQQAIKSSCEVLSLGGAFDVGIYELANIPAGVAGIQADGYHAWPVVSNHTHVTPQMGTVNALQATLTGFEITLRPEPTNANVSPLLRSTRRVTTTGGILYPESKNFLASDVVVLPASIARDQGVVNAADQGITVVAELRPIARIADGEVKGSMTPISIRLTHYGLFSKGDCPTDGVDPNATTTACDLGQDDYTSCCTQNGSLVCGKAIPAKKQ